MCVPMAKDLLKWTDRDISFFFSGAGVVVSYDTYEYGSCTSFFYTRSLWLLGL